MYISTVRFPEMQTDRMCYPINAPCSGLIQMSGSVNSCDSLSTFSFCLRLHNYNSGLRALYNVTVIIPYIANLDSLSVSTAQHFFHLAHQRKLYDFCCRFFHFFSCFFSAISAINSVVTTVPIWQVTCDRTALLCWRSAVRKKKKFVFSERCSQTTRNL